MTHTGLQQPKKIVKSMAATPNLPSEVETGTIGKELLQKEYGRMDPSNNQINYFMILLGQQISNMLKEFELKFAESLDQLGMQVAMVKDDGWRARKLIFIAFNDSFSSEREREYAVNVRVRKVLKEKYKDLVAANELPGNFTSVHIIFSRACLYYKDDSKSQQRPDQLDHPDQPDQLDQKLPLITTKEIGILLKNEYSIGDNPIDYFYLFIQVEEKGVPKSVHEEIASSFLKDLPGDWKILDEANWPGVYFGHYIKTSEAMTEREREMSLNEKVREPLIEKMQPKIRKRLTEADANGTESEAKVHVIITRACQYNEK